LQQPVVDEAYVANQPVRFRQRVDTVHDEADEAVALAAHAIHGRLAVYPHPSTRTPNASAWLAACAASAAAISSFDGMHPTLAHVVPYSPPSMITAVRPSALALR